MDRKVLKAHGQTHLLPDKLISRPYYARPAAALPLVTLSNSAATEYKRKNLSPTHE